jgi:hypothetical protein
MKGPEMRLRPLVFFFFNKKNCEQPPPHVNKKAGAAAGQQVAQDMSCLKPQVDVFFSFIFFLTKCSFGQHVTSYNHNEGGPSRISGPWHFIFTGKT